VNLLFSLCCEFRKPLKTTRILAEMDDETSGTESLCVTNDDQSGLCDDSDYEPNATRRQLSSGIDHKKTVCDDIPTSMGISTYVSHFVIRPNDYISVEYGRLCFCFLTCIIYHLLSIHGILSYRNIIYLQH